MKRIEGRIRAKGFTLIEVLIVVVALAVLAGIAIPLLRMTVEKARKAEALLHLSSVRQSQMRFFAEKGTFSSSFGLMDYDPGVVDVIQNPHFTYSITASATSTFTVTATRNATDTPPAAFSGKTVTLNEAGTVGGTYP